MVLTGFPAKSNILNKSVNCPWVSPQTVIGELSSSSTGWDINISLAFKHKNLTSSLAKGCDVYLNKFLDTVLDTVYHRSQVKNVH